MSRVMAAVATPGDDGSMAEEVERLRARASELERTRSERTAQRALLDELEAARRAVADAEAIEAAEGEHGPIGRELAAVHTDMGVVLLRRPHPALFKRYQDLATPSIADVEKLVFPSIIYPSPIERDRLLERLPGTLQRLTVALADLSGVRQREQLVKY